MYFNSVYIDKLIKIRQFYHSNIDKVQEKTIGKGEYEKGFKYNMINIFGKGDNTINIVLFFQKYAKDIMAMENIILPIEYK